VANKVVLSDLTNPGLGLEDSAPRHPGWSVRRYL
jgi:hypothetical protein